MTKIDDLYNAWWASKVKFARAIVAIEICLEYDDVETNILEHLHDIADNAESEYHIAYDAWLSELEKEKLKITAIQGNA